MDKNEQFRGRGTENEQGQPPREGENSRLPVIYEEIEENEWKWIE